MKTSIEARIEKLREQQKRITQEIKQLSGEGIKTEAIKTILKQMDKTGVTVEELQQYIAGRKKYVDPKTGAAWSGKGRKPFWLDAELKAGKRLDDFLAQ